MALRLRAYADESGWNSGSHCLVSGYVAEPVEWRKFDRMWRRVLRDFEVKVFHAKRFFQRDGDRERLDEYRGWTELKAEKFLSRLIGVIQRCDLHQVGGGVEREAFLRLPLGVRHLLTFGTPKCGLKTTG